MKIYTITHKQFNPPDDPLYVPLHVGHVKCHKAEENASRHTDGHANEIVDGLTNETVDVAVDHNVQDFGYIGDDTGDNISEKNGQYGELTGLYWIWKNCKSEDYVGLVHYRRYFADEHGRLLHESAYREILGRYDVMIGKHMEYDISYEDKFASYHHKEDLDKTGQVIQKVCPEYYETFEQVIHDNKQYVFNLFVAPKKLWDAYAKWLFEICFELEKCIDLSGYDTYRARLFGFLSEELLYVWIKKNQLTYYEADVIYTQEKAETIEFKKALKQCIREQGYQAAYHYYVKVFKERPDLTLEDADINQELRVLLTQLSFAVKYPEQVCDCRYYEEEFIIWQQTDRIISETLHAMIDIENKREQSTVSQELQPLQELQTSQELQPSQKLQTPQELQPSQTTQNGQRGDQSIVTEEQYAYLDDHCVSETMLRELMDIHVNYQKYEEKLLSILMDRQHGRGLRLPVSVIVLRCQEDNELIERTINSVLEQDYPQFECIVVDGAGGYEGHEGQEGREGQEAGYTSSKEVTILDLSKEIFMTVAQLKNRAVQAATYDTVVMLTDGMTFADQSELSQLMSSGEILNGPCFEGLLKNGDMSFGLCAISKQEMDQAGGWNASLVCAEDFELLLRLTHYNCAAGSRVLFHHCEKPVFEHTFLTYAYVLGKYAEYLRKQQLFDSIFSHYYMEAQNYGIDGYFVDVSEKMISQQELYHHIDQETRPVLVLKGEGLCYGVLDYFADEFAKALKDSGVHVITENIRQDEVERFYELTKRSYAAVVGFQSGLFTTQYKNGELWGNMLKGPIFNFIYDHPLYICYHLMLPIKNYYILAQDSNYTAFVKQYMKHVAGAWQLPPAGSKSDTCYDSGVQKKYGISFVGTYNNYRTCLLELKKLKPEEKHLARKLLNLQKHAPNVPIEEAFRQILKEEELDDLGKDEFVVLMHHMQYVAKAIMFYYREKTIGILLQAGIQIHVFSESWAASPYATEDNLVIHPGCTYEQSLDNMAQSMISLNIMSWHKGGMTERIANAMLNHSLCLTDKSSYLEQHFTDGEDIVLFDLEHLRELPDKVKNLLDPASDDLVRKITEAGYQKANREHTWHQCAEQFLKILQMIK